MKQLESALRAAGYRPTHEIRAERDRAIGALVKTRRQKRRGAKQLKAKVLALVAALKVPAPIAALGALVLVLVGAPSLALAHAGHDGGIHHMNAGGALVLVGLTLGLAAHAWANWGPRRALAVSGGGDMAGGSMPEPEPESERTEADHDAEVAALAYDADRRESEAVSAHDELEAQARSALLADGPNGVTNQHAFLCHDADNSTCSDGCDNRANPERYRVLCQVAESLRADGKAWAGNAIPRPYYTVRIPYVAPERATIWHPTEPTGPFQTLTCGAHGSIDDAKAWADAKLRGTPYSVVFVTWDPTTGEDTLTTVYSTEGK